MRCRICEAEIPAEAKWCGQCGGKQVPEEESLRSCVCGVSLSPEAKFCGACGRPKGALPTFEPPTASTLVAPEVPVSSVAPRISIASTAPVALKRPTRPFGVRVRALPPSSRIWALGAGLLLVALAGVGLTYWLRQRPEKQFQEACRQHRLIAGPDSAFRIYLQLLADGERDSPRLRRMGIQVLPHLEKKGSEMLLAWRGEGSLPESSLREYALLSDWLQRIAPSPLHQSQQAFSLGLTALTEGQAESATAHFKQALTMQPNWSLAFHGLGRAWKACQRYGEARQCFERASQLEPGWWVPLQDLADLYQQNLGNPLLGNELRVKAAALKAPPGSVTGLLVIAPQAPGELPPDWHGNWMNEKGEAVLLTANQLHIKPAPNAKPGSEIEHSYTWVSREQLTAARGAPIDGNFGWEAKPLNTTDLETSFKEYLYDLKREKQEEAIHLAMADLQTIRTFPRGSYGALWRYAGGDCGYYNYLRCGDLLLEVQICKYGQSARLLRRTR